MSQQHHFKAHGTGQGTGCIPFKWLTLSVKLLPRFENWHQPPWRNVCTPTFGENWSAAQAPMAHGQFLEDLGERGLDLFRLRAWELADSTPTLC